HWFQFHVFRAEGGKALSVERYEGVYSATMAWSVCPPAPPFILAIPISSTPRGFELGLLFLLDSFLEPFKHLGGPCDLVPPPVAYIDNILRYYLGTACEPGSS
ncbi:MAG: hypothetical protein KTR25_00815, partial [Myxococcales bacterium]|nr:hypothetical protein [Myxococcales bacterium]